MKKEPQKGTRKIKFEIPADAYEALTNEAHAAGYRDTGPYAKRIVLKRRSPKIVDLNVLRDNTMQVGRAVDLAAERIRAAQRDPDSWEYEADLEIVQELLCEVRTSQVEIHQSIVRMMR